MIVVAASAILFNICGIATIYLYTIFWFYNIKLSASMSAVAAVFSSTYGVEIHFFGSGYRKAYLGKITRFYFELRNSSSSVRINNASVHLRIVSEDYIVNCRTDHVYNNSSRYSAEFKVVDESIYFLQVKISWLQGGLMDSILPLKKSKNPVPRFLRHSKYIDAIIFNESLATVKNEDSSKEEPRPAISKPLCTFASEISDGRWVRVPPPYSSTGCPPSICYGSKEGLDWLTDIFRFNDRFVWSPYSCNLKLFTKEDVGTCFQKKQYSSIAFTGDSLVREHFQNLLALTLPKSQLQLERLKEDSASVSVSFPGSSNFSVRVDYYVMPAQWGKSSRHIATSSVASIGDFALHLFDVHSYRLQASCTPETLLPTIMASWFDSTWSRLRLSSRAKYKATSDSSSSRSSSSVFYYLHPRIQFEDLRVDREGLELMLTSRKQKNGSVTSIACMTVERQKIVTKVILDRISRENALRERYVDGWTLTSSRWEASWDGIHYSLLLNEGTMRKMKMNSGKGKVAHHHSCNGRYLKGGRHMCHAPASGWSPVQLFPGVNQCDDDGKMRWCRNIVALNKNFHFFEGGVSRMLTNVWLNLACNS